MRKRRHENSDLYDKTGKRSRTSQWRDENQITKKARIINAQPSIATLFKVFHPFFSMNNKLTQRKKPAEKKQSEQPSGEVHIFLTKCLLDLGLFSCSVGFNCFFA
jgi:hypothetical protein